MRRPLTMLGVLATLRAGRGASSAATPPANGGFVHRITNPYMPLTPGSRWVYIGVKDGQSQRDVVTVTHGTKRILGIEATVVTDVATHGSTVLERTTDWFAQDVHGNVWYLGERTARTRTAGRPLGLVAGGRRRRTAGDRDDRPPAGWRHPPPGVPEG